MRVKEDKPQSNFTEKESILLVTFCTPFKFWEGLPRTIIEGVSAFQSGRIKSSSESSGVPLLPLSTHQPGSTLSTHKP